MNLIEYNNKHWYKLKDLVSVHEDIIVCCYDNLHFMYCSTFLESVPEDDIGYFKYITRKKKKILVKEKSKFDCETYVSKDWFDTHGIRCIEEMKDFHDKRLLELDIPLINILKECGELPKVNDIKCPFEKSLVKDYLDIKWLFQQPHFYYIFSELDLEYIIMDILSVGEWMQDDVITQQVFEEYSYQTLLCLCPGKFTTESVRYKWYKAIIDGLDSYLKSCFNDWRARDVRPELIKGERKEIMKTLMKYSKRYKDDIKHILPR